MRERHTNQFFGTCPRNPPVLIVSDAALIRPPEVKKACTIWIAVTPDDMAENRVIPEQPSRRRTVLVCQQSILSTETLKQDCSTSRHAKQLRQYKVNLRMLPIRMHLDYATVISVGWSKNSIANPKRYHSDSPYSNPNAVTQDRLSSKTRAMNKNRRITKGVAMIPIASTEISRNHGRSFRRAFRISSCTASRNLKPMTFDSAVRILSAACLFVSRLASSTNSSRRIRDSSLEGRRPCSSEYLATHSTYLRRVISP